MMKTKLLLFLFLALLGVPQILKAQEQRIIDTLLTFNDLNDIVDTNGQRSQHPFAIPTLPLKWDADGNDYTQGYIYTIVDVLSKPDPNAKFSVSVGMSKYPDAIDELSLAPDGVAWESATAKSKGIYGGGCGAGSCAELKFRPKRHEFITRHSIKTSPLVFDKECSHENFEPMANLTGLQPFMDAGPWKNFLSGVFILLGDENGNIYDSDFNVANEFGPSGTLSAADKAKLFPLEIQVTSYMVPKDKLFIPPSTWPKHICEDDEINPCRE